MKTANEIYSQITKLNREVKQNLLQKGLVVPIKRDENTIQIGPYFIKKIISGHYNIIDKNNYTIVEGINLPQTAIVIANKLALNKWTDTNLIQLDRKYGYALFDEFSHQRSEKTNIKKKNFERADIMYNKSLVARRKKLYYKNLIDVNFEKLIEFR